MVFSVFDWFFSFCGAQAGLAGGLLMFTIMPLQRLTKLWANAGHMREVFFGGISNAGRVVDTELEEQ